MEKILILKLALVECVFDKYLQGTRDNFAREVFAREVYLNLETIQKTLPHNVNIEPQKIDLLGEFDGVVLLLFEQVAVDVGELADVVARTLGLLLLNEVVENGKTVEEEVWIELLFELNILILSAFALGDNFRQVFALRTKPQPQVERN